MTTHFVVQQDLWNEAGYQQILDVLAQRKISHDIVKVRPFDHAFHPEIHPEGNIVVMGWEGFGIRARSLGWRPGAYLSVNLDQRIWMQHWGNHCLNADATICTLGAVPTNQGDLFLRPVLDDKSFAGRLDTPESLTDWQQKISSLIASMKPGEAMPTVTLDTVVAWSKPKQINAEYRFFVVDGNVVTGSRYQLSGRSSHQRIHRPNADHQTGFPEGQHPWAYAQDRINEWRPHDNCVIDIAETPEGLRIIETGCLNAAGWYESDVAALVDAIITYETGRNHRPFEAGDRIHHVSTSGIVNGTYIGPFIGDLHTYADLEGRHCAAEIAGDKVDGIHPGHDEQGSPHWIENDL